MESSDILIAFDVDGTLNKTETYAVDVYEKTIEELNLGTFTREEILARIGAPFSEDVAYFYGSYSQSAEDEFMECMSKYWFSYMEKKGEIYEGTEGVLQTLRKHGYKLAVCSNAEQEELKQTLKVLGIQSYFDFVQGLTEEGCKSDSLRYLINKARPGKCIMVGDRFYDRKAAADNESFFIGCTYGYCRSGEFSEADRTVKHINEIPEAIADIRKEIPC